ncbi:MAG: hypothetical protein ACLUEQ_12625 [Cloacibacillus evryensis]
MPFRGDGLRRLASDVLRAGRARSTSPAAPRNIPVMKEAPLMGAQPISASPWRRGPASALGRSAKARETGNTGRPLKGRGREVRL